MADPYPSMVPGAFDSLQVLLVKACHYLRAAAGGVSADTPMYPSMTPTAFDSLQVLTAKTAYWAKAVADGGGSGGWIPASGATDPPVDGSVNSYAYRNTVTGDTFINFGTIAVPQWYAV